jgi:hypothetical protein
MTYETTRIPGGSSSDARAAERVVAQRPRRSPVYADRPAGPRTNDFNIHGLAPACPHRDCEKCGSASRVSRAKFV